MTFHGRDFSFALEPDKEIHFLLFHLERVGEGKLNPLPEFLLIHDKGRGLLHSDFIRLPLSVLGTLERFKKRIKSRLARFMCTLSVTLSN